VLDSLLLSVIVVVLTKTDFRDFAFGFNFNLEEIAFGECEHVRNDVRGEHLNLVVEEQNLVVVALSSEGNFIFGACELFLQREEVSIGL
jgi:hypothetical protein